MKTKPVRKYAQPKYPTRLEIAARPLLLHRHQPPMWRKWPELTGAAGLFLLADAARLPAADSPQKGGQTPARADAVAVVAPIFQHGEGRGATGCIAMSPPAFLSEEEALQVIREEMAAKGIKLGTNQTAVAGVTLQGWKPGVGTTHDPFRARAADRDKKVFIEFLSQGKALRWEVERGKEIGSFSVSTVQTYDMVNTATYVAERVKRQATDKVYFGTFYDPMARDYGAAPSTSEQLKPVAQGAGLEAKSRRMLRLQVQDFLQWLQAQGAI